MTRILLVMLVIYLAIGAVFALSILSGVLRRLPAESRKVRWAFWMTNIILFLRWTCGWLPIVLSYGIKDWWNFVRRLPDDQEL